MSLRGTGSAVNGWVRDFYLTSASDPVLLSCWAQIPPAAANTSLWGLTSANASSFLLFYNGNWFWDQYDDTGAEATAIPWDGPATTTGDGLWHHYAIEMFSQGVPAAGTSGATLWTDGVPDVTGPDVTLGLGSQTFTGIAIGVAPTVATEPAFEAASGVAELCVFRPGPNIGDRTLLIKQLAGGVNPLRVPGSAGLRAYHPLRGNFQDYAGARAGFRPLGTPVAPVWGAHPPVDPMPLLFRRMPATHAAVALPGVGASVDSAIGVLTSAPQFTGTGASADSATGGLLASSLQGAFPLMRDSAIGTLTAITHLLGVSASSDAGLAAFSTRSAPLLTVAVSSDVGVAALTSPAVSSADQQLQNSLIDALLRGQPLPAPAQWYVALVTQFGDTINPGVEVSGNGYGRAALAATLTNWSGTQGPGTTGVSGGQSGMVSNNVVLTYPTATAGWGTVVGYEFWDAPTGGNRWFSGRLGTAVAVLNGQARQFPIASLSVALG